MTMNDNERALAVHFGTYFSSGGWDSHRTEVRVSRILVYYNMGLRAEGFCNWKTVKVAKRPLGSKHSAALVT